MKPSKGPGSSRQQARLSIYTAVRDSYILLCQHPSLMTITILDIIHRPDFYSKLNSIGLFVPHRNTSRPRYEPNRLMLSVGLWRWYINITITILDIIYRPVFYSEQRFGDWILSPSSGGTYSVGSNRQS
jgi:hypothetical protein